MIQIYNRIYEKKKIIFFVFLYLRGSVIDIIFTFGEYSLFFISLYSDIFYLIVLHFENYDLYFICFKELLVVYKILPYMPDILCKYCNDKSQYWH